MYGIPLSRPENATVAHFWHRKRRHRSFAVSETQTARLLQIHVPDREASVDFTTQNATVVHFLHTERSDRKASDDFRAPRDDRSTVL